MLQMQFKDRLCRTLLRINWLIAIVAMLPVLSKIFIGVVAIGMAFYYLILIAVTIITLGLFLLNDSFRALYNVDLNGFRCFIFFRRNEIESEERKRQRVH